MPRASSSGHTWPLQYHEYVCIWIIKGPEYRDRISIRMKQKQPNHECFCIWIIKGLEYHDRISTRKKQKQPNQECVSIIQGPEYLDFILFGYLNG